jgi:RND family efflux transporter MFP subunit
MMNQHALSLLRFIRNVVGPGGPGHDADELLLHRFAVRHDQAAFAALVARHGPMVLGVCCRALRDAGDVEDAFQATFLVLARKARSLARPQLLAHWLYAVARRTAQEARARTARRHSKQQPIVDVAAPDTTAPAAWADLRPVLDEEIARLPERYRVPFVLCYLEGRTNREAARLMGCAEGTVASRLAWARQRLRCRLTRRGVTLSAGFGAVLSGKAAMTHALAGCTAEAAAAFAGGARAAEPVVAKVGSLAAEVLKQMFWTKARMAAGLLLTMCLLLGGGGALVWSAEGSGRDGPEAAGREVIVSRPLAREVAEDEVFPGITAVDSVEVGSRLSGRLSKVNFEDGAEVEKGQLLFEIDPRPLKAALDQAEANLKMHQALLRHAEIMQEWAKKRPAPKEIPPEEVEKLGRDVAAAKAGADAAAAARDVARANLAQVRVDAPLAGRIHGRVAPGSVVRANEAVATIVGPGPAYVYFETPLRLLPVLGEGVPVTIGISGENGFPRRGTVNLTGARVDADKGTLRLKAVLPNDGITSGQPARVRLKSGKPYHALLVPQGAVVSEEKGSFVLVVNDRNVVERRPVEVGPLHGGLRVVKAGLAASDWVVLGSPPSAAAGTTIQPRKVGLLDEAGKKLPNVAGATTVYLEDGGLLVTLPLKHASAAEAVRVAKQVYPAHLAPRGRLLLTVNDRTNTLSVEGPADRVLGVVKLLAGFEELERCNSKTAGFEIRRRAADELLRVYQVRTKLLRLEEAPAGPRLGVTVELVTPALADQLSLPKNIGLLVTEVVPQSPAAKVGIQVNDVLLKIDGAPIPADVADFVKLIGNLRSDTPMDVVVMRKGQKQNLGILQLGSEVSTPGSKETTELDKAIREDLTARIKQLEADVAALKDRAAWSERMARKGYMTEQEVQADRARLEKARMDLGRARRELEVLSPDRKYRMK